MPSVNPRDSLVRLVSWQAVQVKSLVPKSSSCSSLGLGRGCLVSQVHNRCVCSLGQPCLSLTQGHDHVAGGLWTAFESSHRKKCLPGERTGREGESPGICSETKGWSQRSGGQGFGPWAWPASCPLPVRGCPVPQCRPARPLLYICTFLGALVQGWGSHWAGWGLIPTLCWEASNIQLCKDP